MKREKFRDNEGFELRGQEKDGTKEKQRGETVFSERWVMCYFEGKERPHGSSVGPPDIRVKEGYR